jgi:hypothetical protein
MLFLLNGSLSRGGGRRGDCSSEANSEARHRELEGEAVFSVDEDAWYDAL